jgi:pimeloyl-ACP methyl ester carboxylesterase
MEMTESVFDYKGLPVTYYTFGKGAPLIVLHGWGASSQVMKPICASLKLKRTFYLIDFPGFGKTPPPPVPWSIDDYTDLTAGFIRSLQAGTADILAHSFGGRITLKLCARETDKSLVGKVIITGGAGMKPRRSPKYYFKKNLAFALKYPFTLLPEQQSQRGLQWLRSTKLWKLLGSSDYKTLGGVMREVFVKTVSEHLDRLLPSIPHEILLIWGKNDDATPLYQAKKMEKGLRNAGLAVIDDAGHYAFLDRAHQFKLITEAFFKP